MCGSEIEYVCVSVIARRREMRVLVRERERNRQSGRTETVRERDANRGKESGRRTE